MDESFHKKFLDAIVPLELYSYEQRESKEVALAFLVLRSACLRVSVVELVNHINGRMDYLSLASQREQDFFSFFMRLTETIDSLFFNNDAGVSEIFRAFVVKGRADDGSVTHLLNIYKMLFQEDVSESQLADVFEWLLLELYSSRGGGMEFYTPRNLIDFAIQLVIPEIGESVYDPVCGTGGFLVGVNRYLLKQNSTAYTELFGRDKNLYAVKIALWNLYIHSCSDFSVSLGDSLSGSTIDRFKKYDLVLANPPFSVKDWNWNSFISSEMSLYGSPPRANADYAFLQHIIFSLSERGRAAVIVPAGVLFRGGAEKEIRKNIINDNLIEMIVSLPAGVIKGTGVSLCMIFLSKRSRSGSIVFAGLSNRLKRSGFESPALELNKLLELCKRREDVAGSCRRVSVEEIELNDFDLSVSRYVSNSAAEERGVSEVAEDYIRLENELRYLQDEMKNFLDDVLE
ncbi:putative type I restriction enzymeP M protein [compost metagenome]